MNELIRPRLSRRALLTLGGLSLLTGCSAPAVARTAGVEASSGAAKSAGPSPSPSGAPVGATGTPVQGTGTGFVTASASPSPSTTVRTGGGPDSGADGGAGTSAAGTGEPEFYVHQGPHAIALTVDDGPDPRWTPQVLELLERHGITATFCQVGQQVDRFPGLVGEVAAQGHLLANHTWTHADMGRASAPAIRDELIRTSEALERVTGAVPTFFRAPYGSWSRKVLDECHREGLTPLDWSVDPRDWSRPGVGHIVSTIMRSTRPGSIILEHDGGGDRSQTVAALRIVLPRLLDAGYTFVTP